jgi:outer membrane receptor protein involved in Fe transport
VITLGASYRVRSWLSIVGQINNLFDRRYYTSGQLGPMGFTSDGSFAARPFPSVNGEFPVRHATFYAPGAPIRASLGARLSF